MDLAVEVSWLKACSSQASTEDWGWSAKQIYALLLKPGLCGIV